MPYQLDKRGQNSFQPMIITSGNNSIEVINNILGKEVVKYNGREVSSKRTMAGGTHVFKVTENEEEVQYEVELGLRWHGLNYFITVRRKGELIFSNK